MKNSFDEKILEEANDWIKANQKVVLATVFRLGDLLQDPQAAE